MFELGASLAPSEMHQEAEQVVSMKNSFHLSGLRLNAALAESVCFESP